MEESTSKEKVLKRIRNALISKTSNPYPEVDMGAVVYEPITDTLDITFAQELTKVGGQFIYCENMEEMLSTLNLLIQTKNLQPVFCKDQAFFTYLEKAGIPVENDHKQVPGMRTAITFCELLIAYHGSIMLSSRTGPGRQINILPEAHIVIARTSQLVPDLRHAFSALEKKYLQGLPSMVNVITGPSRTADIEKTLVMGAHGPKDLYVFLIDDVST